MSDDRNVERLLDRAIHVALLALALAAPISIAATQTAWAIALLFWIVRAVVVRPSRRRVRSLDLAVIAFLGVTVLSSLFSYEPEISIRKLVAVSLVTIVYLVSANVRSVRLSRHIVVVLIVAASASVLFSLGQLTVGRNLKLNKLAPESPLAAWGIREKDTVLSIDGRDVNSPEDLAGPLAVLSDGERKILIYRHELLITVRPPADFSLSFTRDLGITEWSRGRDTRAAGFYGHYTTFAEALQLVLSLVFAAFLLAPGKVYKGGRLFAGAAVLLLGVGLFLAVTRASWGGFAVSATIMVIAALGRKAILLGLLLAIPMAIAALLYLQKTRQVAIIDNEYGGSTSWRLTVWREAFDVMTASPRHLLVGVGMDSLKKRYLEWRMFNNGQWPIGHLHSTPYQIAFERGIPALIAWLVWMFIYLKLLWLSWRNEALEWPERALLLGAFGGGVGFLASGLVHYNWGDSEVVMIFYLIMGLSLATIRSLRMTIPSH